MKPVDTIRQLEFKHLAAFLLSCSLAIFIGFMLIGQYLSNVDLEKGRILDLKQNSEKRAIAVSYFFSERFSDLEHLASTRSLSGYFENKALGMSMRYGLRSSLSFAASQFSLLLAAKTLGQDPIYSRLIFITGEGDILIDTLGTDQLPPSCSHLLSPGVKKREILWNPSAMMVSMPYYFKGSYAGQLVSFLDPKAIDKHLVRQASDSGQFFSMAAGNEHLYLPGEIPLNFPGANEISLARVKDQEPRELTADWNKDTRTKIVALRTQVSKTPFSIISLTPVPSLSLVEIYATMAAFGIILMTGIFFIWRTITQKLIFGVRLDEYRQSEKRFRDLVEFLPIPVAEYGFDFIVRYANREAISFFGYTKEEVQGGKKASDLIPEKYLSLSLERIQRLEKGEIPDPVEMSLRKKNGKEVWVKVISSLVVENGVNTGVRTCFIDYTQRLESEKESILVAQQEKYALVGQVAGKMAHDFNNILGAIMGNAELSLLDCQDQEMQQTLEIILDQAKRGNILTRNLVAFAKDQEIKEEYFNVNDKIDLVLNLLRKDIEGIRVIKKYQDDLPELLADAGMIEHALVNLIQNSVHAMGLKETAILCLETCSRGTDLIITIRDNGCGIPKAYAKEIYSPSFTLKGIRDLTHSYGPDIKGTGYGLSNVKKYIDKHKGSISFSTTENEGTQFRICLPLIAKILNLHEKEEILKKPVIQNKKILVVEDEEAISMVLTKLLTMEPFFHKVRVAQDGRSAIDLLDRESFDLVSLDYVMPGRMNGLDVYKHIRKTQKTLPVLFISGNIRFIESMEQIRASDSYMDHLSKPFANQSYADKVNDWLQLDHLYPL